MGGFGSGERLEKKTTVERCLTLDVGRFSKAVEVKHGLCSSGELTWTNSRKEQILSLRYWLEPKAKDFAVLHITTTLEAHRMEPVVERIRLTCTVPNFGGLRWWFVCPLVNAGVACNRRVKKLFLPPSGQYIGCRTCFNLTYESAQSHDHRLGKLMKDPGSLVQAINSQDPLERLMGLRAYSKLCGWT